MNYGAIKLHDVANGEGVRVSIFVSGCRRHCPGCFNADTWSFDYGQPFTEDVMETICHQLRLPYISGLSILGGEPLEPENIDAVIALMAECKAQFPDKTIWLYTGFQREHFDTKQQEAMKYVDVLVDGPYVECLRDPSLAFRGSSNQRIIHLTEERQA